MAETLWLNEIREIQRAAERALETISAYLDDFPGKTDACASRVEEAPIGPVVNGLIGELLIIKDAAGSAFERYSSSPTAKFLSGRELSVQEYYLLRASLAEFDLSFITAMGLGLAQIGDHEAYTMLLYEDDNLRTLINPALAPRGPIKQHGAEQAPRFGKPPEKIPLKGLSAEQHEFFRRYLPQVYERFKR